MTPLRTLSAVILGAVVAFPVPEPQHLPARAAGWTSSGPPFPIVGQVVVDPTLPTRLYAVAGGRLFRSDNGGENWGERRLPEGVRFATRLFVDPSRSLRLWLSTEVPRGLFASANGGRSWRVANRGVEDLPVQALAVDPDDPAFVLAGTSGLFENVGGQLRPSGGIFRSSDGGSSWTKVVSRVDVSDLVFDRSRPVTLYAAIDAGDVIGVLASKDHGAHWTRLALEEPANALVLGRDGSPALYAAGEPGDGLFRSEDRGRSWTAASDGLALTSISALAASTTTIYASAAGDLGIFKSDDRGESWQRLGDPGLKAGSLAADPVTSRLYAATQWGVFARGTSATAPWRPLNSGLPAAGVLALTVDPARPATLYSGGASGVFRSTDAAKSWRVASKGLRGLGVACFTAAAGALFACTRHGVFASVDGAGTWSRRGLEDVAVNALLVHPSAPASLYAGTFVGVFRSEDAGVSWQPRSAGLTDSIVTALTMDPTAPRLLYAGTAGFTGLFRSEDGGAIWQPASEGLNLEEPIVDALVVDPAVPSRLYARVTGYDLDLGGRLRGRVFKSEDGGRLWRPLPALDDLHVTALAVSPKSSLVLAATVGGEMVGSRDGGLTWRRLSSPGPTVTALLPETRVRRLYAATVEGVFAGPLP